MGKRSRIIAEPCWSACKILSRQDGKKLGIASGVEEGINTTSLVRPVYCAVDSWSMGLELNGEGIFTVNGN
jgi:hypothetical protein